MREILFRGKKKPWGGWCEGFLVKERDHFRISRKDDLDGFSFVVDPETVGQFTGRNDKNGKRVFESDILQLFTIWADGTMEKSGKGIVRWSEHDQCYVLATKQGYHIDDFGNLGRPEYYEVIGNIHDNPELMEVENA